ncbi:SurA N-terminal domain-containing protein [Buchnera aphidicola]|uniref:SurA N-terminal domain-containing protein n=1 Tax=Buchnera aphidicola TaxID=9 RepID=UPI0022385FB6|nr:SurA N-terminal domain-containing protein [Buchnera aphidicola]MCW5197520.1 SurA N-terminal domain-containing protein [Buchnera aphidicola (Chaitophorus viminalis)]
MNLKDTKWFKKIILSIIIITLLTSVFIVNLKNYYKNNFYNYNYNKFWLIKVNNQIIETNQIQKIFEYKILLLKKKYINNTYNLLKNKIYIKNLYKNIVSNLINKSLIKDYIENNNLKNNKKNTKNLIMKIDLFKKNNKFNSNLYNQFLKKINFNENEYLEVIGNKITEKFFFNDILNSNNIFKKEKLFLNNLHQERILCKKYIINFKKIISQQQYTQEEINNFYNLYKKFVTNQKKFQIKFLKVIPFFKSNQKIKKLDILKEFQNNRNKYSIIETKQISLRNFNTKKQAIKELIKIKKNKKNKLNVKKIFIQNHNFIKNFHLNWITKKKFLKIINTIKLNKINQISQIIKFKNKFIIFKLDNIKKFKNKNIDQIKNIIKKKLQKKKYKELIKKINLISINQTQYFNLLEKTVNQKPIKTNWFTINSIPKEINFKIIKNFFKNKQKILKEKQNRILNYRFFDEKKNIFIQIINYKNNTIKPLSKIKKKIIKLIKIKKSKITTFKKIEKIEKNLNQKQNNQIYEKNIIFDKKKYLIKYKNKSSLFLIKKFNKNYVYKKPVYIKITNYKNKWIMLKLYKKYFIKLKPNEKNKIYIKSKIQNQKLLIKLILESLRSKARIQYNINEY